MSNYWMSTDGPIGTIIGGSQLIVFSSTVIALGNSWLALV